MIDWDSLTNVAAQLLSGYLQIQSLNPPGDERATADFLAAELRLRGLEPTYYESAPNRVNLVARLPGNGTKKPFAAADEEKGGKFGAQWMIEHHWPEIEADFVWDEGGFGLRDLFGPRPVFTVAVAEKKDLWLKLVAHGEPGHSGMPHKDNAANILLCALGRVLALNEKYELNPVTRAMFAEVARLMPFPKSILLRNLGNPLVFWLLQPTLAANLTIAAMLKDTLSITVLRAGGKENIIPELAAATLDVRLLPERDPQAFLEGLKRLIDDPRVEIEIIQSPAVANVSDTNSDFFQALSGVLAELVPQGNSPLCNPVQAHERGIANQFGDIGCDFHLNNPRWSSC